jgi:hypothetical protein
MQLVLSEKVFLCLPVLENVSRSFSEEKGYGCLIHNLTSSLVEGREELRASLPMSRGRNFRTHLYLALKYGSNEHPSRPFLLEQEKKLLEIGKECRSDLPLFRERTEELKKETLEHLRTHPELGVHIV